MIVKNTRWLCFLAILTSIGCKKDDDKSSSLVEGSFAGQTYYVVEAGTLERTDKLIKGSGAIVFAAPLDTVESQDNFAMDFSLADGGSLTLVTHADSALGKGIAVQFDREASELTASLKADGAGTGDNVLSGLDASAAVSLSVDVHNNETPAHVLIWNAASGSFGEDDAIYNSEADTDAPGNGKATLWGLVFRNAELSRVSLGEAKFSEE